MRILLCSALLLAAGLAGAAEPEAAKADPALAAKAHAVLQENCFKCHGPDKHKGDLRLDSEKAMLKGGEDGPVVVPGDAAKSPLIGAIGWADKDTRMPPKKKLSDEQIATLTAWVKAG